MSKMLLGPHVNSPISLLFSLYLHSITPLCCPSSSSLSSPPSAGVEGAGKWKAAAGVSTEEAAMRKRWASGGEAGVVMVAKRHGVRARRGGGDGEDCGSGGGRRGRSSWSPRVRRRRRGQSPPRGGCSAHGRGPPDWNKSEFRWCPTAKTTKSKCPVAKFAFLQT